MLWCAHDATVQTCFLYSAFYLCVYAIQMGPNPFQNVFHSPGQDRSVVTLSWTFEGFILLFFQWSRTAGSGNYSDQSVTISPAYTLCTPLTNTDLVVKQRCKWWTGWQSLWSCGCSSEFLNLTCGIVLVAGGGKVADRQTQFRDTAGRRLIHTYSTYFFFYFAHIVTFRV